jgi:glycosyltransferase 2 family protein
MDRVVGLIGLLFLGAVMVVVNLKETLRSPATRSLGTLSVGGFLGGLAVLYIALMAGNRLSRLGFLPGFARNVFSALHEYRKKSSVVPVALGLSVLNQAVTCAMYYLAMRATGISHIPVAQFFLVVPLGMMTCAIPISPGGVGVGQAAFFALFRIVAPAYAAAGTDAFTVFQVVYLVVCLSGMYWYLSYKRLDVDKAGPVLKKVEVRG